jgi:hypothetical protein
MPERSELMRLKLTLIGLLASVMPVQAALHHHAKKHETPYIPNINDKFGGRVMIGQNGQIVDPRKDKCWDPFFPYRALAGVIDGIGRMQLAL